MNYTSIEQSKHLLESGLKPETSDMYYLIVADNEYSKYPKVGDKENILNEFPCWSVGALIDLMPVCIIDKNCILRLERDFDIRTSEPIYCIGYIYENDGYAHYVEGKDFIKTMIAMIEFLLKNNYIKTE